MNKKELEKAYREFAKSRKKKKRTRKKDKPVQWFEKPGCFKYGFSQKCIADFYNEERRMALRRNETIEAHEKQKRIEQLRKMGML